MFDLADFEARPRALDLCCAGGGAARGLHDAGFDVTGIDIIDRSAHYPYRFLRADVLRLDPEWIATFDLVWASPPCQRYTKGAGKARRQQDHPDLLDPVRDMLAAVGVPFILENVPEAEKHGLRRDLMLCGKMFGLPLIRHRVFEYHLLPVPAQPDHPSHDGEMFTVTGNTGGSSKRDGTRGFGTIADWQRAMGIDWLPSRLMAEAIPPAFTQFIGQHIQQERR